MKAKYILNKKEGYFSFDISKNVKAIFSIKPRSYKNINLASDSRVIENRKWLCGLLDLDYENLIYPNQKHSAEVYITKALDLGKSSIGDFDAVIATEKRFPLAIFTADCLPIFFLDSKSSIISLAHAGWRGTYKKIVLNVVNKLKVAFNTDPRDVIVCFGPGLRSCCYKVSDEFIEIFPESVINKDKKFYFDLIGENIKQLVSSGIRKENIFDSKFCSWCDNELFFSHRKEGRDCGRTISLMALL
ncbi:MAG: peptidoglycan editing factor PgeF [Candidatus Omnitrophica bacterium]|nr:peptidoglycan editing factor PgeF [Candidatus Omnitrophota bacterium]